MFTNIIPTLSWFSIFSGKVLLSLWFLKITYSLSSLTVSITILMPPQLITPLLIAKQTDGNLLIFSCHGADTWFSSFLITAAKWPLHLLEGTFCLSFLNSKHDFPVFLLLCLQLPHWILHFWSLYQHFRDVAPVHFSDHSEDCSHPPLLLVCF